MKAEFATFCGYAEELHRDNFLSQEDLTRVKKSIEAKGIGFVRDLDELCGDIRLALSRGYFELSEHTHKVFTLASKSVLPRFLLGSLSRLFEPSGVIRDDYCRETASTMISFLSCLKRIDPDTNVRELEEKVWSNLRASFLEGSSSVARFFDAIQSDTEFSYIMAQAKLRFREYMDCPIMPELAFGPGANLDKFSAIEKMNWLIGVDESHFDNDPVLLKLFRELKTQANHAPFQEYFSPYRRGGKRRAYGSRDKESRTLRRYDFTMKCSAQPKSYKAYRGVGVMSATRMAMQLALQRSFYRYKLDDHLPLNDASEMERNLVQNFEQVGTIDLSSASDRLFWPILRHMGHDMPFFEACYRLRTRELILPDGVIHCASPVMGEAITFPLMSAFFAAVSLAVCDYYGWGHNMVKIYGDDIQSPHYFETIAVLELCGAKVSGTKSYPPQSRFKESCEAHYVADFASNLRYARPAYIPSGSINNRGKIPHGYAHILLTIAHDAWKVCTRLSKSLCDFVESHTRLVLPNVYAGTGHLGRPSRTTEDYRTLVVKHESKLRGQFTVQGWIRQNLYSAKTSSFDPKVQAKQQRRLMTKTTKRLELNDQFRKLEVQILRECLRRNHPDYFRKFKDYKDDRLYNACFSVVEVHEVRTVVDEIVAAVELQTL
jgi:hypothetical protein